MFDVERALAKIEDIAGSKIAIKDVFYHDGTEGYLKGPDTPVIKVIHDDLHISVKRKVAAYGGGKYLYRYKCYIEGRIDIGQDGQPFLDEIEIMKLMDEGKYVDVIGGTDPKDANSERH